MSQAVVCDIYPCADNSCLVHMGKDINDIVAKLNKTFNCLCDWFVENKLSIHFGENPNEINYFWNQTEVEMQCKN